MGTVSSASRWAPHGGADLPIVQKYFSTSQTKSSGGTWETSPVFYKPLIAIEQMIENSVLPRSLRIRSVRNIHSRNFPLLAKHVYLIRKNHDLHRDMSDQQKKKHKNI